MKMKNGNGKAEAQELRKENFYLRNKKMTTQNKNKLKQLKHYNTKKVKPEERKKIVSVYYKFQLLITHYL